jgi:subtilase family serine protease
MNKCYFNPLVSLLLAVLIVFAIGCTAKLPQQPKPMINSFSVTPAEINPGQWTTIEWSTSGAKNATINPEINNVGTNGSLKLSPDQTTMYVLTATNEVGSTKATAIVTVIPANIGKPDLIITDMFCVVCILHYKIKNQGNAVARPSRTQLMVPVPSSKVLDWVDYLNPGEEITKSFSSYVQGDLDSCWCGGIYEICADADNEVEESNEDNNCLIQEAH